MDELLKKLDEIMTNDLVRKIGGLFCLITVILTVVGLLVGAGSLLSVTKKPEAAVESTAEEVSEEAIEVEDATEELEEETEETTEEVIEE